MRGSTSLPCTGECRRPELGLEQGLGFLDHHQLSHIAASSRIFPAASG
jgi:hypothetical protein